MEDNSIDSERIAALIRENQELRAAHEERLVDIAVLSGLLEEAETRGRRAAEEETVANTTRLAADRDKWRAAAEKITVDRDKWRAAAEKTAADRDKWRQRHREVQESTSWKVTGPFRRAVRLLKKLRSG